MAKCELSTAESRDGVFPRKTATLFTLLIFLSAILLFDTKSARASDVGWYSLVRGVGTISTPPTNLNLLPSAPTVTNVISFVSPANGSVYFNDGDADSVYGDPSIAVDPSNLIITVTFSPPTGAPVPLIASPVGGVSGQFGPLAKGLWTFKILTNCFQFQVVNPPASIAAAVQSNGAFRLQISGQPGQAFDIQATTDLQDWLDIGLMNADQQGNLVFVDTNTSQYSSRFYLAVPK